MTDDEILGKLTDILRDLLDDRTIVLTEDTTRSGVANWDSFAYVTFIVAVEGEFNIKFNLADVEAFETVGDIVRQIQTALH